MHSENDPSGADDQLPYSEPPSGQRPTWLIWTIVGGAAALVAVIGAIGIVTVTKRDTPSGTSSNGLPNEAAAAVDQLRSHLPEDLRFAPECVDASPRTYGTATIECTWPKSNVPRIATYSLFEDSTSMLKSAMNLVRDSDYGSSCRSADDFSDNGGQMLWQRDERDRGTVWCHLNDNGEPAIVWTDTTPKILAAAIASAKEDAGKLLEWFRTTGQVSLNPAPVPQRPPQPAPTMTTPRQPRPNNSTRESTEPPTPSDPGGPSTDPGNPPSNPADRQSDPGEPRSDTGDEHSDPGGTPTDPVVPRSVPVEPSEPAEVPSPEPQPS